MRVVVRNDPTLLTFYCRELWVTLSTMPHRPHSVPPGAAQGLAAGELGNNIDREDIVKT